MSDHEFGHVAAGDPLPDRLKQYLTETSRRELEALRADLEVRLIALETALARPEQHHSIETLVFDLARVATSEAEAAASRAILAAQFEVQDRSGSADALRDLEAERKTVAALRADIEQMHVRFDADVERLRAGHKDTADKLAAAQRDLASVQRELKEARRLAEARASEVVSARDAAGAAQAEAAARIKTLEAKLKTFESQVTEAERIRRDALGRADAAEVLSREIAARASNAEAWGKDVETRLQAAESRAAREDARVRDAEARAEAAVTARDQLAAEIEALKQTIAREQQAAAGQVSAEAERTQYYEKRLAAADEKIRMLELQLFQRDRPEPGVADEELADMLATKSAPFKPTRVASRYSFGSGVKVEIDGRIGALIDLSTTGAQVLSPEPLDDGHETDLRLISEEIPTVCRGRIMWSRIEPKSPRQPLRYRVGILFTRADVGAIEAFIIRYAAT
jgi:chromosome segregation ATPase